MTVVGAADLVFLTGPGGAGTTTLAAATAVREARSGRRVLLLGVADAGQLAAVLGEGRVRSGGAGTHLYTASVRSNPAVGDADSATSDSDSSSSPFASPSPSASDPAAGSLTVKRFDAAAASESALGSLTNLLSGPLAAAGFSAPDAAELGPVPGLPDILALRMIAIEAASGAWDTVVVDGPPLRAALDMLAWPETAAAALRRLRPIEGQAGRSLRPLLAGLVGLPSPMTAVTRWTDEAAAEIEAVRAVFTGPASVVRLVGSAAHTAQPILKAARTILALHGLRYDTETLDAAAVPRRGEEPVGEDALAELADAVYGSAERRSIPVAPVHPKVEPDSDGYRYDLPLPGVERDGLGLVRSGDELVVTVSAPGVAGHRRAFLLPAALRRCRIASARLDGGFLRVGFKPDESLWPERLLPESGDPRDDWDGSDDPGASGQ